jgi:hypothetical protein
VKLPSTTVKLYAEETSLFLYSYQTGLLRGCDMKTPNTYRWQQERIGERIKIIEATLQELDDKRVTFKKITYLAKYVADAITRSECQCLAQAEIQGIRISKAKTCRASSLLKSKSYRLLLDMWIRRNNGFSSVEGTEITELRLRLIKLSNEHNIIVDELRSLQQIHSRKADTLLATTERNDGMTIANAVIMHFQEFCEIESGALIEPSPTRPTIVPANLFSAYLKWKSNIF